MSRVPVRVLATLAMAAASGLVTQCGGRVEVRDDSLPFPDGGDGGAEATTDGAPEDADAGGEPDSDPCVQCDPDCETCADGACQRVADGTACTADQDACTLDECRSGRCEHPPMANDCGQFECGSSVSGCVSECGPCPSHTVCSDQRTCVDPCDGIVCGTCGSCEGGICVPYQDGTPCDDGNPCTGSSACAAGVCVGGDPTVIGIATGGEHSCAIKADGTLWCWGENGYAQLGDGTVNWPAAPRQVVGLPDTVWRVAAGLGHTCAVLSSATLWCWGLDLSGQIGDGDTSPPWLESFPFNVKAEWLGIARVSAGPAHTCAVDAASDLWCWGDYSSGQIGNGKTCSVPPEPCDSCCLDPSPKPVSVFAKGMPIDSVATGAAHTCALALNGSLWCWGDNEYCQLGQGNTESPKLSAVQVSALGSSVTTVAAGVTQTCAVLDDGTLWCWGQNTNGQLGDGTVDGSPPYCKSLPVQAALPGHDVAGVTSGDNHTCAWKKDGTAWCWGANDHGQIGDGTIETQPPFARPFPVQVGSLGNTVVQIAAGGDHTCALRADGSVWCWGADGAGQMGTGKSGPDVPSPMQVQGLCP